MSKWDQLADDATIGNTIKALKQNGIEAEVVENGQDAKNRVLELIPEGAEVMNNTSVSADTIGLTQLILESKRFNPVRDLLMSEEIDPREKKRRGAAPEYTTGSVHAVTEDGHVLIASNTGSQLPAYVYAADQVIWIVGTQKIVKNSQEGIKRIYEYTLPLEDKRAQKAYGVGSNVNKLLIINKEVKPDRLHIIFVKQKLGF